MTSNRRDVKGETTPGAGTIPIESTPAVPEIKRAPAAYWDSVAAEHLPRRVLNPVLDEHKKLTHERLLARWADIGPGTRFLKTDLFEEATGPDQLLFDLAARSVRAVGMDISCRIARLAGEKAAERETGGIECVGCDIRRLPFRSGAFDVVLSTSTLDHFPDEVEIVSSVRELTRILRPGGTLILTIDNKNNLTYPPYSLMRLWMGLHFAPYFIGKTLSLKEFRRFAPTLGLEIVDSTTIFHFPHPDILVKKIVRFLRFVSGGKHDGAIMRGLLTLDRLGDTPLKYLTGRYLALKMVKKEF